MVGPSSSHTAGACRIGWAAARILGTRPDTARIGLHGSFASTGEGHGTREALIAGLLGMGPDDERLQKAPELADSEGLAVEFQEVDLGPQAHPNSTRLELQSGEQALELTASSIGGGSICITSIDGLGVEICGKLETFLLWHRDTPGFLARVTAVLACMQINVASIRTSRVERGQQALTVIEIDGAVPEEVTALLRCAPAIHRIALLPILPGN